MMNNPAPTTDSRDQSYHLVANGALMMLVGLLCGLVVSATP